MAAGRDTSAAPSAVTPAVGSPVTGATAAPGSPLAASAVSSVLVSMTTDHTARH